MSQILIHDYLQAARRYQAGQRQPAAKPSCAKPSRTCSRAGAVQQDLVFLAEYPLKTATRANITVDGALLHQHTHAAGLVGSQGRRRRPGRTRSRQEVQGAVTHSDNIVFTDDVTAALWQGGNEAMRCSMTDTAAAGKAAQAVLRLSSGPRSPASARRGAVQDRPARRAEGPARHDRSRSTAQRRLPRRAGRFLAHAQEAINPGLGAADVREMLIQHILTEEIFSQRLQRQRLPPAQQRGPRVVRAGRRLLHRWR
jgi:hypothetical protein